MTNTKTLKRVFIGGSVLRRVLAAAFFFFLATGTAYAIEGGWTRRLVIAVADQQADMLGYDVDQMSISFDPGNRLWGNEQGKRVLARLERKLEGRDFWAVHYAPLQDTGTESDLWVFIDRESGSVIAHLRGGRENL